MVAGFLITVMCICCYYYCCRGEQQAPADISSKVTFGDLELANKPGVNREYSGQDMSWKQGTGEAETSIRESTQTDKIQVFGEDTERPSIRESTQTDKTQVFGEDTQRSSELENDVAFRRFIQNLKQSGFFIDKTTGEEMTGETYERRFLKAKESYTSRLGDRREAL